MFNIENVTSALQCFYSNYLISSFLKIPTYCNIEECFLNFDIFNIQRVLDSIPMAKNTNMYRIGYVYKITKLLIFIKFGTNFPLRNPSDRAKVHKILQNRFRIGEIIGEIHT